MIDLVHLFMAKATILGIRIVAFLFQPRAVYEEGYL